MSRLTLRRRTVDFRELADAPAPSRPPRRRRRRGARSDESAWRELAVRCTDGLRITLLWRPSRDDVMVAVADAETGHRIELPVPRERALHAFYHPFVHAL
jgi:hypothetical protein